MARRLIDRAREAIGVLLNRQTEAERYPEDSRVPYFGRTQAGVYVDPDRALTNGVVWACHRYLTQTVGQLPPRVMREMPDGVSIRQPRHPVNYLLGWRPNPELAPFQLKETLTGWAITHGNGIAEIERDAVGRAIALWPIHPDRIEIKRDLVTGELVYEIDNDTQVATVLEPMDVLHVRGFGNGPVGLSVIEYAAESIGWAQATQLFSASFFGEGLNPAGIIESVNKLTVEGVKNARAELDKVHKGPRKAHRFAFLDNGMKASKWTIQPDEAQFIETRQHQVEELCRWFGVPPHKVMHLLRSTFSNIEHQAIEVVVDSIAPWALRWEEECNYKLFGQNRMGFYVKFDLKGLLRGDFKSRQEGLQVMRRNGVINALEWRELEDMGPMPATGGEKYIVEGNMTTLQKVGEEVATEATPDPERTAQAALENLASMMTEAAHAE
jgi:HK97 family phage portal protein